MQDVAAQHLAQGGELLLQSHDFCRVAALHAPQLLQQFLGSLLFNLELSHERVVVDLRLHLVVLHGELLVLVLHLEFVHLSQFEHLLAFELLLAHSIKEEADDTCHQQRHQAKDYLCFLVHTFIIYGFVCKDTKKYEK